MDAVRSAKSEKLERLGYYSTIRNTDAVKVPVPVLYWSIRIPWAMTIFLDNLSTSIEMKRPFIMIIGNANY